MFNNLSSQKINFHVVNIRQKLGQEKPWTQCIFSYEYICISTCLGIVFFILCTGGRHYALYRFLSISNKFCFQVYCTVYRYNLTTLCTILPHWGLEGEGGYGPWNLSCTEPLSQACLFGAHLHKITNGRFIYMALYVMILMRANPLRGPLEGPWTPRLFWAQKGHRADTGPY